MRVENISKTMSNSRNSEVLDFIVEGRLIDFSIKDGYKLKGLRIETTEGEVYVKLAKHLRINFNWMLPLGTPLRIYGEKKVDTKTGCVKFKAQRVIMAGEVDRVWAKVSPPVNLNPPSPVNEVKPKPAKTETILVCRKSDCMKRGGKKLCQVLQAEISDRGLDNHVTIKGTGCMKSCKAGPNLVMPDKTRYKRIQATEVPALVDKHFASKNKNSNSQEHCVPEVDITNTTNTTNNTSRVA